MKELSKTRTALGGLFSTNRTMGDYTLYVEEGPARGASLHLSQEFVRIGRADWCDLVLAKDDLVSHVHCECTLDEKGVRLKDLDSRNGILLGGHRVFDIYLNDNSEFKIGNSVIRLKSHHKKQEIEIAYKDASGTLVGKSPQMRKLFSMLPRLAQRKVATLLLGETGTGKTSIANAIHLQANEKGAPFVVVNCGALPSGLIESQLFGYEKGAFTGAQSRYVGFFQQADGGTLFLDEIAELPIELQPKLLDVLERRKVRPLGSQKEYDVDFHLVSATLRDLSTEIAEGRFREDLYFRLSVVELDVPSLRERSEDFQLIVEKLMQDLHPNQHIGFSAEAMQKLKRYHWPGNIRELRNILERSITFLDGFQIDAEDIRLPTHDLRADSSIPSSPSLPAATSTASMSALNLPAAGTSSLSQLLPPTPFKEYPPFQLKELLEDVEKEIISQALDESERDVQDASDLLLVSPAWLYARIRKYELRTKNKRKNT